MRLSAVRGRIVEALREAAALRLDLLAQCSALGLNSADLAHEWDTLLSRAGNLHMHSAVAYYKTVVACPAVNVVATLAFAPILLIPFRVSAADERPLVVTNADRRALGCTWAALLIYAAIICPQYLLMLSMT